MTLSTVVLLALAFGGAFGALLNGWFPDLVLPLNHYLLGPIGAGFLRLVQFVVAPIVFSSLVLGLTRVRGAIMGRYILKLLSCYGLTGMVALGLGMTTALVLQPGLGMTGFAITGIATPPPLTILDWVTKLVPINPVDALAQGNLLQIIVSAALFSVGIQLAQAESKPVLAFLESLYVICERILGVILYTAPLGVFALMSSVVATQGLGLVSRLLVYVLGILGAMAVMIGLYTLLLAAIGASPLRFFRALTPALSLAFGTASSNATLPMVLRNIQEGYGLRTDIASFAIPLGTALKRDGSAILQSFNALFVAQLYHVPLTPSLLGAIALASFLVSFSTPGVPGSALITMTTVLAAAGLPLEAVALVAGVDRLTDGLKTVLNIIGSCVNAILLSRWEAAAELAALELAAPELAAPELAATSLGLEAAADRLVQQGTNAVRPYDREAVREAASEELALELALELASTASLDPAPGPASSSPVLDPSVTPSQDPILFGASPTAEVAARSVNQPVQPLS